jgi:hypothetical protein
MERSDVTLTVLLALAAAAASFVRSHLAALTAALAALVVASALLFAGHFDRPIVGLALVATFVLGFGLGRRV